MVIMRAPESGIATPHMHYAAMKTYTNPYRLVFFGLHDEKDFTPLPITRGNARKDLHPHVQGIRTLAMYSLETYVATDDTLANIVSHMRKLRVRGAPTRATPQILFSKLVPS